MIKSGKTCCSLTYTEGNGSHKIKALHRRYKIHIPPSGNALIVEAGDYAYCFRFKLFDYAQAAHLSTPDNNI